jgi:integrase
LPSGSYRVQIRRKGIATERKVFKTEAEAKAWASDREHELIAAHSLAAPRISAGGTLAETINGYFSSPKFQDKRESTQKRERVAAKPVIAALGRYSASIITGADIQNYFDERSNVITRNGKIAGHTIRLEKALLSATFKYAKRRNLVPVNIMCDTFETIKCKSREIRVTPLQQQALLIHARMHCTGKETNPATYPWIALLLETGMRPGEAAKVELTWLDLANRQMNIPKHGQKLDVERTVLLPEETVSLLKKQVKRAEKAGSKFLFYSEAKKGICTKFAYDGPWRIIAKRAGVPGGPHACRHEYISRLFEETDLSDSQIAVLAGDKNVLSLKDYKHLRAAKFRPQQQAQADLAKRHQEDALADQLKAFTIRIPKPKQTRKPDGS